MSVVGHVVELGFVSMIHIFGELNCPGLGGAAVTGEGARKGKEGAAQEVTPSGDEKGKEPAQKPKKRRRANPLLKRLTPNAVVRRMRFGKIGVTCVIDHFGESGPEVFSEEISGEVRRVGLHPTNF